MKVNGYVMSGNPEKYGKLSKKDFTDDSANEDLTVRTFESAWVVLDRYGEVQFRDVRMLSPQERAFKEKMEAAKPKPEAPKVFPAPALRDMTDKTFASLLGMNQFIGGGE